MIIISKSQTRLEENNRKEQMKLHYNALILARKNMFQQKRVRFITPLLVIVHIDITGWQRKHFSQIE